MATVSTALPDLSSEDLSLYHTTDPLLSDATILIFYGPVATANSHVTSSRIQAHIFSPAGFQSYSRITISPAAPLYVAVNHLPREKQGDETCRGLAVSLLKYFADLSEPVKNALVKTASKGRASGRIPTMFDEMHAAELANRMLKVDKSGELIKDLQDAYREKKVSWVDMDVVLPPGSINPSQKAEPQDDQSMDEDSINERYGQWSSIVKSFGEPVFLPTSKLRRAPSQSTNTSKSKTFSVQQKESLRRTMCEFVDTEERYVNKVYDLVHNVAEDFIQKSSVKGPTSTSPEEHALSQLFPLCLNQILEVNMGFLDAIRRILEETEKDALTDLSSDTLLSTALARRNDLTGSVSFAKALLEWLPRFSQPYAEYMRAHSNSSKLLNEFIRDGTSSFSQRVQERGEQMIRSMLMEPIQRLPRYSLLIDTMTGSLPAVHPAVRHLLKARDLITDICALEPSSPQDSSTTLKRLQELAAGVPHSWSPQGRVITAFDMIEISPPYSILQSSEVSENRIALVLKDTLVLFTKGEKSRMTSRGLLAELDKPASNNPAAIASPFSPMPPELMFSELITLNHVNFSHSTDARVMYMTHKSIHDPSRSGVRAFVLAGSYESKAPKLSEDLVKATIEGRYPESEREDGKWALLSPGSQAGGLSILAAVLEEGSEDITNPRIGCSNIRVVFDKSKRDRTKIMNASAVDVIVSISETKSGQYRLEVDSQLGSRTNDLVTSDAFVATLIKRITALLHPINDAQNPQLTDSILHSQFSILRHVAANFLGHVKTSRGFRPPSPTKLISSVLSSTLLNNSSSPTKKSSNLPTLNEIPKISPPSFKAPPMRPQVSLERSQSSSKITLIAGGTSDESKDPIKNIEETFEAYVLALQSRSGNIVSRTLRARSVADELEVNELYNILLESPSNIQAAAEVSVDVLFGAFEKFLRKAWKDQIGPVVKPEALSAMQNALDSRTPGDFEKVFKHHLGEMAPQNRRALTAMIKVLAVLLDASGNDGDRGELTLTFAEFVAQEGSPLECISLLDRLTEDFDRLFDDTLPIGTGLDNTLVPGSMSSKSATTGSVSSSKSSSWRGRFGFGLSRENSKLEPESKVGSIIRSLSKTKISGESDSAPSSFSKATSLLRSKSTDTDARLHSPSRPGSRDRPGFLGAFGFEEGQSRPNSAHNNVPTLSSIGEKLAEERQVAPRKKRRSSLSDLQALQSSPVVAKSPAQLRVPITPTRPTSQRAELGANRSEIPSLTKAAIGTPVLTSGLSPGTVPTTKPIKPSLTSGSVPTRIGSPTRFGSPTRSVAPNRKENAQPSRNTLTERAVNRKSDEVMLTSPRLDKRTSLQTSIPTLKSGGLSEQLLPMNGKPIPVKRIPSSSPQKPQRLRIQSPQKLRERLHNEKKSLATAESNLQAELSKIGEELSALKLNPMTPSASPIRSSNHASTAQLANRITALQAQLLSLTSDLTVRNATLESDLRTTLVASERKVKKLDELYRDAGRENEALYERFNEELSKAMRNVKGRADGGVEELKTRLGDVEKENEGLRRENWKLKREVLGLRTVVQGKGEGEA